MAVVTRTTGLTNVLALGLSCLANRLAEGHLRLAHIGVDLVLALHAVHKNFEVQLTHAANDRLARILVRTNLERGIFIGQLRQRDTHLLLIGLGLWLDRNRDNRLGEDDRTERNRMM